MGITGPGSYFITHEGEIVGGPGLTHAQAWPRIGIPGSVADALAAGHTRVTVTRPSHVQASRFFHPIEVAIEAPHYDALEWAVYVVQRDLPQASIYYDITERGKAVKSATIYPGEKL